jgi:hypothetical protein
MAICHDARKGRHSGSHWSKPVAPPLYSTNNAKAYYKCVSCSDLGSVHM